MTDNEFLKIWMDEFSISLTNCTTRAERTIGYLNSARKCLDELKSELKYLDELLDKWQEE